MSSDLKVGILSTIYATWLHNNLVIALVLLMLVAAVGLILRPKRKFVFFFLGALLLVLEFEYQKHFGKSLEEQTINSVILTGGHVQTKSILEDFFSKMIPFSLWVAGWGLVILGMIF